MPDDTTAVATEVVQEPSAPSGAFGQDDAAPADSATDISTPETTTDGESAPSAERSWQTLLDEVNADESLKSDYEAHIEDVRRSSHKEGMSAAQKRLQPILEQSRAFNQQAWQNIEGIRKDAQAALKDGTLDKASFEEIVQSHEGWVGVAHQMRFHGTFEGAKTFVGLLAADNPELAKEYQSRIDSVLIGSDTAQAVAEDFIEAVVSAREKKAEERGFKRGLADGKKAASEVGKVEARNGKGPTAAPEGSSGGGHNDQKRLDRLSLGRDSDGREATDADRAWLASLE